MKSAAISVSSALLSLWVLVTASFFLVHAAPGGPFDTERSLSPQVEAALAAHYHLDEPLWRQYLRYLNGLAHADLGPSYQYEGYSVQDLIAEGLPVSALLGVLALMLALLSGVPVGLAAALRRDGLLDRGLMALTTLMLSVPSFVVAPLLVLAFAVSLGWLPAGGWESAHGANLVLPVVALALPQLAYVARLSRTGAVEALRAPYMLAARARGVPVYRRLLVHALRPALLPVLSHLGPAAAGLLTGSVVIAPLSGLPGIGRHFVQAALNRDYAVVLGVVLLYGSFIIVFNAAADLLYGWLDPRARRA